MAMGHDVTERSESRSEGGRGDGCDRRLPAWTGDDRRFLRIVQGVGVQSPAYKTDAVGS